MHKDAKSEAIFVVDDFFADPDHVRGVALADSYPPSPPESLYPGRNSAGRYEFNWLASYMSEMTGDTLVPAQKTSHGSFRICLQGEVGSGGVHIDPCHWSCLVYLSKPEHCKGGTDFFRHRKTKTVRAPVFPGEFEELGVERAELGQDITGARSKDPAIWERIRHVPMKYNRMVLFRPWLWHDAGDGFGDRIDNGRLIFVAFFVCTDPGWDDAADMAAM